MTQILEYFLNNYTLFLVGAIIILLAIVGYYADKTNFGQGKNSDNKEDEMPKIDINKVGLMDVSQKLTDSSIKDPTDNKNLNLTDDLNNQHHENISKINSQNNNTKNVADDIMSIEMPTINNEKLSSNKNTEDSIKNNATAATISTPNNAIANAISKEFGKIRNDIILNVAKQQEENQKIKQKEEELKKFNDEFNSVLPKIELVNSDLLEEIDDLELEKTQKLSLNDLTKLEDINLPRINSSIKEDHEIWKF